MPASGAGGAHGPDDPDGRLAANRSNWDERVALHVASDFYDVEGWLARRPGPREGEVGALGEVTGLDLVHLQCHFGLDTLAWADAGATVTGLDFSPQAVAAARIVADRAGLSGRATFVCADVLDAAAALSPARFDIVYVSLGALCWLPDVGRWADQVAALLRPRGRLYLHDTHPLTWALDDDGRTLAHTYFEEPEPYVDDSPETYADGLVLTGATRTYEWNHSLGEVATALLTRGLHIDRFEEHDWTVHQRYPWLVEAAPHRWVVPPGHPRLPLTFTLVATRVGGRA